MFKFHPNTLKHNFQIINDCLVYEVLVLLERKPKFDLGNRNEYRHSSILAVNVGTHKNQGKQKLSKLRLVSSTKGEEDRIELSTALN